VHEPKLPVIARTLRGLEWIARGEVRSRLEVERVVLGHRELRFSAPLVPELLALGTVDDVFVFAAELDGVTRHRESLARLASLRFDLGSLARLLGRSGARTFDVVASFLGRRNYNRFELADALGLALAAETGWAYVSRRGELSLRVHVVDSVATVAVRIARTPLHRRAYRVATVPGSLHPPLACALAVLAAEPFVDPFCGAGTIPIEGALAGLATSGSDIDPLAVEVARTNAVAAGVDIRFAVADAVALGEVDCVVTNPPWGKAVPLSKRSLPRARRLVLLTADRPGLRGIVHEQTVRVHGRLATITVAER
jgi:tRNA (guanine6-N2)-methyltransferase